MVWKHSFYIIIIIGYIFATIISQNKSDKTKDVSRWYRHINDHNGSTVFFKKGASPQGSIYHQMVSESWNFTDKVQMSALREKYF